MTTTSCDQEWSTERISPRERLAYWREAVHEAFLPLDIEQHSDEAFAGRLIGYAIGSICAARGRCRPHVVLRTRANIARTTQEYFYLMCPVEGRIEVEQLGRSTSVRASECALITSAEPFRFDFPDDNDVYSLQIPSCLLTNRLPSIRDVTAVNFGRETALGATLSSFAQALPGNRLRGDPSGCADLSRTLLDLVVLAAKEARRDDTPADCARRRIAGADVVRFVEAHLADPMLSPRRAARALGVSERAIHLAMKEMGETFMGFVRTARLDRIVETLGDFGQQPRSMTDLAFDSGYSDLSTFYRAFRQRFRMTPKEYLGTSSSKRRQFS